MKRYKKTTERRYCQMPFSAWEIPYGNIEKDICSIIFCNAMRDYIQRDVYQKKTGRGNNEKIYILDTAYNKRLASLEMREHSMVAVLPRSIDAEYVYDMFGVKPKRKM